MKHPTILPGRRGLPTTSNVAWSAHAEKWQRFSVISSFVLMWLFVAAVIWSLLLRNWIAAIWFVLCCVLAFGLLQRDRRKLYAMLLNKPRDIGSLTMWTEHRWTGWEPLQRQFFCACGRLVDLSTATYFKDTRRYARVCECGRGHFLVPPAKAMSEPAQVPTPLGPYR